MGDNRRNNVFATFLTKQFPHHPENILDVACGDGRLSVSLAKAFPFAEITGVDPKPRGNKRRIKFLRGRFPDRVKVERYDLIVGMHPDEATWAIVQQSCHYHIPFAIVPCCLLHVPPSFGGGNMHDWIDYIVNYTSNHRMRTLHSTLPIRGANHVICGVPLKETTIVPEFCTITGVCRL